MPRARRRSKLATRARPVFRMDPDEPLLARLRSGEVGALEDLYRRHGDRVYGLCLQILGREADAEDATQEVFLKLLDRSGQFRGRSLFSTWLFRMTVNHCLHRLERERVRRTDPLPAEGSEPSGPSLDGGPSPLEAAAEADEARRVRRLLARLPLDHRVVLHLREIEGLSYREIASALSIPPGTVMSRLARAREGLARLLGVRLDGRSSPEPISRSAS